MIRAVSATHRQDSGALLCADRNLPRLIEIFKTVPRTRESRWSAFRGDSPARKMVVLLAAPSANDYDEDNHQQGQEDRGHKIQGPCL